MPAIYGNIKCRCLICRQPPYRYQPTPSFPYQHKRRSTGMVWRLRRGTSQSSHTTHLLSLYPYSQITLDKTPELAQAAAKTIEKRLAAKDWEDTEWSRANMICFYARLKDSEKAYSSVKQLLGKLSRENMFLFPRPESPEQVKIFSPSTEIQPEQQVWQKCYCKVMIIASNYCLVCRKNGKTEVSKDFVAWRYRNRRKLEKRPDRKYGIQGYRCNRIHSSSSKRWSISLEIEQKNIHSEEECGWFDTN